MQNQLNSPQILSREDRDLNWEGVPDVVDLVVVDRINESRLMVFFREKAPTPSVNILRVNLQIKNGMMSVAGEPGATPFFITRSADQTVLDWIKWSYQSGYEVPQQNIYIEMNMAVRKLILGRPEYKTGAPTMDKRLEIPSGAGPIPLHSEMETFNHVRRYMRVHRVMEYVSARRVAAWVPMRESMDCLNQLTRAHLLWMSTGQAGDLDRQLDFFEKAQQLPPIP